MAAGAGLGGYQTVGGVPLAQSTVTNSALETEPSIASQVESAVGQAPTSTASLKLPSGRIVYLEIPHEGEYWTHVQNSYADHGIDYIVTFNDTECLVEIAAYLGTLKKANFTFNSYGGRLRPESTRDIRDVVGLVTRIYRNGTNPYVYGSTYSALFLALALFIHENYNFLKPPKRYDFHTVEQVQAAADITGREYLKLTDEDTAQLQRFLGAYFQHVRKEPEPKKGCLEKTAGCWKRMISCCCGWSQCCRREDEYVTLGSPRGVAASGTYGGMGSKTP